MDHSHSLTHPSKAQPSKPKTANPNPDNPQGEGQTLSITRPSPVNFDPLKWTTLTTF